MKALEWKCGLAEFICNVVATEWQRDEVELGFEAMLSHEVIKFLTTNHSISKALPAQVKSKFALDEHELAMV